MSSRRTEAIGSGACPGNETTTPESVCVSLSLLSGAAKSVALNTLFLSLGNSREPAGHWNTWM